MNNSKNQNTTNSKFLNFTTMKNYILYSFILLTGLLFNACSDDDTPPAPVDEEEVITTLMVTLTSNTGQTITLNSQDLDGDGPNDPTISVSARRQRESFGIIIFFIHDLCGSRHNDLYLTSRTVKAK